MAEVKKYIAVDLGAESGRVMLGSVSANKVVLEEIHRFGNGPIKEDGSLRWDFMKLFSEIKTGIGKAAKAAGAQVWGIGIDSWGVDFGLLDADGEKHSNSSANAKFTKAPACSFCSSTASINCSRCD